MSRQSELAELSRVYDSSALSNRNVIINGAMKVAQRATSSTGIGASSGYFTVDRYKLQIGDTSAGRLTMTQEAITDLPGFANCAKLACTTADTSIAAGELLLFRQILEGQDLQQFAKGTSDAKEFTVSFYVKGNASATYVCELFDGDNSRQISKTFSVTTSWTRVVLTFPADTTGAFADDNGISLYLQIWLHGGSNFTSGTLNSTSWASNTNANRASSSATSFFDSTDRTFFITGVQIEVGSEATPFEHRSFGDELARCQRYTFVHETGVAYGWSALSGYCNTTSNALAFYQFPVKMRVAPSLTVSGNFQILDGFTSYSVTSNTLGMGTVFNARVDVGASGLTAGRHIATRNNNDADAKVIFDAEL